MGARNGQRPSQAAVRQAARERKRALRERRIRAWSSVTAAIAERGLSQNKLAKALGYGPNGRKTLGNYFRGESRMPESIYLRICELLAIDPAYLLSVVPADVVLQKPDEHRGRKPRQQREAA